MKIQTIGNLPRLLVAVSFAALLASCSSSSTPTTQNAGGDLPQDSNLDGITDILDGDFNGDGVVETIDLDFNGDGFVDTLDDRNNDGRNDFLDFDINGDDNADYDDDTNQDGRIDIADVVVDNTDPMDCEGEPGTDYNSSTSPWDDNCQMRVGAPYVDSSYSRGIQRILWCQGFADPNAQLADFADGSFGPTTQASVVQFQQNKGVVPDDGIVGPITWGALRDQLVELSNDGTTTTYGINSVDCNGQAQFFQDNATGSWRIADAPGGTSADSLVFSTGF